ncbi:MAG: methyltransferase domain-containing protein [Spirochaetota bacterium]
MGFYETLSEYYDVLFPMEDDILNFLNNELKLKKIVLDLACGTGTYSFPLAQASFRVIGIDSNSSMIEKAKRKVSNNNPSFYCQDIKSLKNLALPGLDGAFCIGNSIVHLATKDEVYKALQDIKTLLMPEGRVILQIVNYDRVLNKDIRELPTLSGENVTMYRRYSKSDDPKKIVFTIELAVNTSKEAGSGEFRIQESIPLLALQSKDLTGMVSDAGFKNIRLYGSYGYDRYIAEESFLAILTASG